MNNKNLLILGAGQYGQVAKEIALSMNYFDKVSFLDDKIGGEANRDVIGKTENLEKFVSEYTYLFVAIGNAEIRLNLLKKAEKAGYKIPVLISQRAYISAYAQIMKGSIIEPMAVIQTGAVVSAGTIVSSGAVIRHNAFVGEGCHCDCNSVVMSGVAVPAMTKIECCSIYKK